MYLDKGWFMNKVKILFLCLISMIININCSSTKPTGLKSTNNSSSSHSSKKLDTLKKTEIPIFRHVIEHDFNKQDSFQLISQWLAISYNNLEIYTDYINEEYGKIIGTVVLEPKEDNLLAAVKLTYIIEMKDNRFRLTTKNFLMAEYSTFIKTIEEIGRASCRERV